MTGISPTACNPSDTEADVEFKVVDPLLQAANYLEVPAHDIKGKGYLAPIELDKASGKNKGYFPDFSVWRKTLPLLIVEAKAPSVVSEVGYREACLYARHLNQLYAHDVNPCTFVLSTNGLTLLVGHWDTSPTFSASVSELVIGSKKLEELRDFCHYSILSARGDDILKKLKHSRVFKASASLGGQAALNAKKPFNTFAAEIAPVLRRYFTSQTQNDDPDIYEKGYVNSDDATEYDKILESLLKDRLSSRRGSLSQDIQPTKVREPKLAGAIASFQSKKIGDGQLQLITGSVGSGKSLFVRRFKELLQPADQRDASHWAFIDFNNAPASLNGSEEWLCRTYIDSFQAENPEFDVFEGENLARIFSRDLQTKKGIYAELRKVSKDRAALKRIEDLEAWQQDPLKLAFGICRHFAGDRRHINIIVMDNVDKLDLTSQLAAFQMSLWFMAQSKAFIILQMRDETYERFKNRPPLDTFRTGVNFHISPPRFLDFVKRRLELSLDVLSLETKETLTYYLSNGSKITYPKTMIGEFLKGIYLELFEKNHNISRVLQGLAGRDVRQALEMFVSILNSGHLKEEAITSVAKGAGLIGIDESNVLKILMRTEYRFFSDVSGFIRNIYYIDETWEAPNCFIIADILFWLCENRKKRGQIGLEGFFTVGVMSDELQLRGHITEDVLNACKWMLERLLIEADHMNHQQIEVDDCIKVTASGFIHIRVLSERIEYIYGVLASTSFFDKNTASEIGGIIRIESETDDINPYQKARCVELFRDYLVKQYDAMKASYPEFGGSDTGAGYIIQQTNTALKGFRSPRLNATRANVLDD